MLILVVRFLHHRAADDKEGGADREGCADREGVTDRVFVRVVARSEDVATTKTRLALLIQHRVLQEHVLLRVLQRGVITNLE